MSIPRYDLDDYGNGTVRRPQGAFVRYEDHETALAQSEEANAALRAELTKARALIQEADDFLYMLTAHDHETRFLRQHSKSSDEVAEDLRGKLCTFINTPSGVSGAGGES